MALVILLFALARLWRLTASCLWFDEIFSVHAAEHPWGSMLHFVAADLVHPPLFYLLLKIWIGIGGESLLWLRLLPAMLSIAAIVPVFLLARELRLSSAETTLALLLLAINGYLVKYAQDVRMYALFFFLGACSLWLFVSWWRSENQSRRFVVLMVVNLLMVYTHYYAWVIVLIESLLAFFRYRRQRKQIIPGFAILVMGYVPWLIEIARAYKANQMEQNIGWIQRPGLGALIELATLLNQPFVFSSSSADNRVNLLVIGFVLLIFGCPLAWLTWQTVRTRRSKQPEIEMLLPAIFFLAPVVALAALSWILPQSIWGTRHLIIVVVPYSLLAAIAIIRLRPYWARVALFLIGGGWFATAAVYVIIRPAPHFIWCAWAPLAQQVRQTTASSSPTSIYAFEDLVAYHLWFALKASKDVRISVIKGLPGTTEDPAYFLPRDFDEIAVRAAGATINEPEVWVAFRAARFDDSQPPLSRFTDAGYQIERVLTEHVQPGQDAFMIKLQRKQE